MSDSNEDTEGQNVKSKVATLTADGEWMYLKGEYRKAINSFTAALALNPDERKCYVGRAKCFMKIDQFENVLKDAKASLRGDKSFFEGLYLKAEALYYMGKFEFALVFYHRGQKVRPQMQGFRFGIQKAQEAIENAVGCPSVKLEVKENLSFPNKQLLKTSLAVALVDDLTKEKKHQTLSTTKDEKITKQLLGEFYADKKFLEDLMKDKDLVKGKTKHGEQLQDIIQSCLSSLDTCSEFWSQERPISLPEGNQQRSNKPSEPTRFVLKRLCDIDAELASGDVKTGLKKAEEVMRMVQKWSKKDIPNKDEILCNLHSCIGKAFFLLGDMDEALMHHQNDLKLAERCKLPNATSRALYNIGHTYAENGHFEKAIEYWEQNIPLIHDGLEKTWMFHDIGLCYLKLHLYEEARDYGLRAAVAAEDIADAKWQLNANVLAGQAELKLRNFKSSVSHFEKAVTLAQLQEDDAALSAIQMALDEAKQHQQD